MNYKLNFKTYVMFMIFVYVMLYVYGTINRALDFIGNKFPLFSYFFWNVLAHFNDENCFFFPNLLILLP
jgi:hypothetical protein